MKRRILVGNQDAPEDDLRGAMDDMREELHKIRAENAELRADLSRMNDVMGYYQQHVASVDNRLQEVSDGALALTRGTLAEIGALMSTVMALGDGVDVLRAKTAHDHSEFRRMMDKLEDLRVKNDSDHFGQGLDAVFRHVDVSATFREINRDLRRYQQMAELLRTRLNPNADENTYTSFFAGVARKGREQIRDENEENDDGDVSDEAQDDRHLDDEDDMNDPPLERHRKLPAAKLLLVLDTDGIAGDIFFFDLEEEEDEIAFGLQSMQSKKFYTEDVYYGEESMVPHQEAVMECSTT
ncbi:hypothetical protein BGZ83_010196 [Gryganskiella cystojenkinii]|nr:hypothetical protein BGZ83_010196 [Gryganskiella cystojenkinii]